MDAALSPTNGHPPSAPAPAGPATPVRRELALVVDGRTYRLV